MDTRASDQSGAVSVEAQLAEIRAHMPAVYSAVQAKAAQIGGEAYRLVRRGLRGDPDCFYALERGRVVGTPFGQAVMADVAAQMVEFGGTYLCIWPAAGKDEHGAN